MNKLKELFAKLKQKVLAFLKECYPVFFKKEVVEPNMFGLKSLDAHNLAVSGQLVFPGPASLLLPAVDLNLGDGVAVKKKSKKKAKKKAPNKKKK